MSRVEALLAKNADKYKGKPGRSPTSRLRKLGQLVAASEAKTAIAKDLGVGRSTLGRLPKTWHEVRHALRRPSKTQ